jgi:signal transduction histidine kinase
MVDHLRSQDQRGLTTADDAHVTAALQDAMIQRLFAAALTVEEVRRGPQRPVGEVDGLLAEVVGGHDDTIREVRTAIFELQRRRVAGLRDAVLATIHEAADSLGFEPHLHYEAPAGAAVADSLAPTVAAVLREALSGAARRSHADRVEVTVEVRAGGLRLSVADNGSALESVAGSSAVADLEHRAEHLGGTFDFDTPPGGGTRVTWQAPLPPPVPGPSHRGPQGAEPAPA